MKWPLLLLVIVVFLVAYLAKKKNNKFKCLKCDFEGENIKSICPSCGYNNKPLSVLKSGAGGGYS
jgi:lipopolysaccharide biosynthesis regulator YciM